MRVAVPVAPFPTNLDVDLAGREVTQALDLEEGWPLRSLRRLEEELADQQARRRADTAIW